MKQENFQCTIVTSVRPMEALEKISRVAEWWTSNFTGRAGAEGDKFTVRFGDTYVTFEVTELEAGERAVWLVTDCHLHWLQDKEEWKGTEIVWELEPTEEGTVIHFTHLGLVPEIECYTNCVKGWTFYVTESLRTLVTEGKGMPETPKEARAGA